MYRRKRGRLALVTPVGTPAVTPSAPTGWYVSRRPVVRSVRVRLCTLTFHGYARLRTLTPQHSARLCTLGLGDTKVDLLYSHARVLCRKKNWCWWNFCLRALCAEKALKGLSGIKKKMCTLAHAWTGRWRTLTHTYHLTLRTLNLVCAHASNHGSGLQEDPHPFTHSLTHDQTSRTRGTALEHP